MYAHYFGCESVLEIGAGYSTAIWAEYAKRTGAEVTSVDANFELLERYLGDARQMRKVDEYVNMTEGVSVNPDEIRQFHSEPQSEIGGVEVPSLSPYLDLFARAEGAPYERVNLVNSIASTRNWTTDDLLVSDERLQFPEEYIKIRVEQKNIKGHVDALKSAGATGTLDELVSTREGWDLIWFDSGEVSSLVEWVKLKDYINPGGLAAFHDIYFPKSMKNIVPCASILAEPEWEVLTIDDSTKQGLLIARKSE